VSVVTFRPRWEAGWGRTPPHARSSSGSSSIVLPFRRLAGWLQVWDVGPGGHWMDAYAGIPSGSNLLDLGCARRGGGCRADWRGRGRLSVGLVPIEVFWEY
jgi:hypothetical protein